MPDDVRLAWRRFEGMVAATRAFKSLACIYVIANPEGRPLYIGGSGDLDSRYHGGTAASFDAALHGSGNVVYVAESNVEACKHIEKALIWAERPPYNRQGKIISLSSLDGRTFVHDGDVPAFEHLKHTG